MKTPEQRARKWLRLYPRAYRERRGEELLATVLDKARHDPRLPMREIQAIMVHAATIRVRRLPLVAVVAGAAVLGAGLGAVGGSLSGPSGYVSTVSALPAQLGAAKPSSALTRELRAQLTRFVAFRGTPAARGLITRNLATPYPLCSVSFVDTVGDRGVQLQCSSSSAEVAQVAVYGQSRAIVLMFGSEKRAMFAKEEAQATAATRYLSSELAFAQRELDALPSLDPRKGGLERALRYGRVRLLREQSLARTLAVKVKNPGAIASVRGGPALATYGFTALPVELGGAAGLLLSLAVGIRTRRAPRRPARA